MAIKGWQNAFGVPCALLSGVGNGFVRWNETLQKKLFSLSPTKHFFFLPQLRNKVRK